jgi:ABC-type lipoprotein export system ATPase subunit
MLRIEQLSHTYPNTQAPAITIGSLRFNVGDAVLLRGVSGSGKTTLLHIIAGLRKPTEGRIFLGDKDLYVFSESERDRVRGHLIGYVLQNHHLLPNLSAMENVIAPMAFARIDRKARQERARHLLRQVQLDHLESRFPAQLSTGQRQRVAIARALANSPKLLLADEPTAALDSEASRAMIHLLRSAASEYGGVLIVASHDPALEGQFPLTLSLQQGAPPQRIVRDGNHEVEPCEEPLHAGV